MLKNVFDKILSLAGLIISVPLWAIVIVCILIEDGPPVFFLQERVGKNGKLFNVVKFRTMKHSPDAPHSDIDLEVEQDHRITNVGKILRKTAMDELPQLINILKGDMSFVGPRALPMRIDDSDRVYYKTLDQVPGYSERIKVCPGLTGLSQIYSNKETRKENKFKYDIIYVKKRSFLLDIKLIAISFWITFNGAWEKREKKI